MTLSSGNLQADGSLTAQSMSAAIDDALSALVPPRESEDLAGRRKFALAIAQGVIKHLGANAITQLTLACSDPAVPAAGDAVRLGEIGGVALTNEDAAGNTVVDFGPAVYTLNVHDNLSGGILVGQKIYYEDTAHGSPASQVTHLGNRVTGAEAFFGYALTALGDGVTGAVTVFITRRAL